MSGKQRQITRAASDIWPLLIYYIIDYVIIFYCALRGFSFPVVCYLGFCYIGSNTLYVID